MTTGEYRPDFDERKFRNLILYVAQRAWTDPTLGKTKLYKILWLSDFLAYARVGRSITGADYVRMPHGPGPTRGERALRDMERAGDLMLKVEPYFGQAQLRPLALVAPQLDDLFEASEIALVEEVIRQFEGKGAIDLSDFSHDISVGWQLTTNGERIPYETVFLSPEVPSPEDEEWAREMIIRHATG